jgi:glycosyltransferase involved in cell wall biosynthesis
VSLRVLAASSDVASVITDIRVVAPLSAALARRGGELRLRSFHALRGDDLDWAEVFVVQRGSTRRPWRLMQRAQERGAAVVYEIDDLLTEVAPHLQHRQSAERFRPWVLRCLRQADLVTVTSPRLAGALGCSPGSFRVVPNAAFAGADRPLPAPRADAPATLLFVASDRVAAGTLLPVLRLLQARRGSSLEVVGVGVAGDDLAAAGIATRRVPVLPRAHFVEFVRSLPNAVAVIPLDDSRFSACKSAIKWFDYAEIGVPTLASDASPYRDVIRDGETGALVADREAAWEVALTRALDDMAWRGRVARAARAEVRTHHAFGIMVDAWLQALEEALARAAARPQRPLAGWRRWRRALADWADDRRVDLRQLNRDRIARRQGAGKRS